MNAKRTDKLAALPRKERLLVLYAHQANSDTWGGGMTALVKAERSHVPEVHDVVSQVYSRSSGRVPEELDAYECGECGCVHYGREAADLCCVPDEDEQYELDEENEVIDEEELEEANDPRWKIDDIVLVEVSGQMEFSIIRDPIFPSGILVETESGARLVKQHDELMRAGTFVPGYARACEHFGF